ncbi:MAG: hypothetical protein Kow0098_06280 [Ignavibacteriaceae bacterium]
MIKSLESGRSVELPSHRDVLLGSLSTLVTTLAVNTFTLLTYSKYVRAFLNLYYNFSVTSVIHTPNIVYVNAGRNIPNSIK